MASSNTADMAVSQSNITNCSYCQKPTHSYCHGCDEAIAPGTLPQQTYYCNPECQKADWAKHKAPCNNSRRQKWLHRAAFLIQEAFYLYRSHVFDISVARVKREGNLLHVYEGNYGFNQTLVPFPDHLKLQKEDREKLFTHLTCHDALAWMHELTREALEGIYVTAEEVSVTLKEDHKRLIFYRGYRINIKDEAIYSHFVTKLSISGGDVYALDFASAQYGYHDPIVLWEDFLKDRVTSVDSIIPFGTFKSKLGDGSIHFPGSLQGQIEQLHVKAVGEMDTAVKKWLFIHNTTLKEIIRLREDDFLKTRAELLTVIDGALTGFPRRKRKESGKKG